MPELQFMAASRVVITRLSLPSGVRMPGGDAPLQAKHASRPAGSGEKCYRLMNFGAHFGSPREPWQVFPLRRSFAPKCALYSDFDSPRVYVIDPSELATPSWERGVQLQAAHSPCAAWLDQLLSWQQVSTPD